MSTPPAATSSTTPPSAAAVAGTRLSLRAQGLPPPPAADPMDFPKGSATRSLLASDSKAGKPCYTNHPSKRWNLEQQLDRERLIALFDAADEEQVEYVVRNIYDENVSDDDETDEEEDESSNAETEQTDSTKAIDNSGNV